MTATKSAEVIIDGKVYTLSGYEEEGYLQKVASYINNKIGELQKMDSYRRFSSDTKAEACSDQQPDQGGEVAERGKASEGRETGQSADAAKCQAGDGTERRSECSGGDRG